MAEIWDRLHLESFGIMGDHLGSSGESLQAFMRLLGGLVEFSGRSLGASGVHGALGSSRSLKGVLETRIVIPLHDGFVDVGVTKSCR
jgi:hypothetical protein